MLGEAGSIASLVGVVVSLGGLGFAILQLLKLRGETRAAMQAAEATRRAVGRDLAIADIGRTYERIQALKGIHRQGVPEEALYRYPEIRKGLIDIRSRYPDLPQSDAETIANAITLLQVMEELVESGQFDFSQLARVTFNPYLTDIEVMLGELGSRLQ
jgi:hypothetical protein